MGVSAAKLRADVEQCVEVDKHEEGLSLIGR